MIAPKPDIRVAVIVENCLQLHVYCLSKATTIARIYLQAENTCFAQQILKEFLRFEEETIEIPTSIAYQTTPFPQIQKMLLPFGERTCHLSTPVFSVNICILFTLITERRLFYDKH